MQSTLPQPIAYPHEQYQQHYGQGQYMYPNPMLPVTMPYVSQQYGPHNSPPHLGDTLILLYHSVTCVHLHAS